MTIRGGSSRDLLMGSPSDPIAVDPAPQASFPAIFERELDYVWASLRRLGVADRDLEDVAQEVFVQVHRRLSQYDRSRPLRPWLFAFAFRCASDWRRLARHRVEVLGLAVEAAEPAARADEALERRQDRDLVLRALEEIEIDRRAVFILHELDECPMKEIAVSLGIALFTGYSRLRVAREEFASAVRALAARREAR
jgi:RNA polymerase sigma-70 factor (ECF subfamily)